MNAEPPSDFWRGERVQLCALSQEDFEAAEAGTLLPDSDAERSEDRLHFLFSNAQHRAQLERLAAREGKGDDFFWVIRDMHGARVGTINTFDSDARVGTFKYGVTIVPDQRRKGYAREAITLVLRYYFHELCYQKVTAIV